MADREVRLCYVIEDLKTGEQLGPEQYIEIKFSDGDPQRDEVFRGVGVSVERYLVRTLVEKPRES